MFHAARCYASSRAHLATVCHIAGLPLPVFSENVGARFIDFDGANRLINCVFFRCFTEVHFGLVGLAFECEKLLCDPSADMKSWLS